MKITLIAITLYFIFVQFSYSQISFQDLDNILEMDKDHVTLTLKKLDQNWKYIENRSIPTTEKWINNKTILTIKNFQTKEFRKLEYYTNNSELYKNIVREMGFTNTYKPAIIKETPKVIYNFWHGESKTAVGHIICSETDTICLLQLDLMKNKAFMESDYN